MSVIVIVGVNRKGIFPQEPFFFFFPSYFEDLLYFLTSKLASSQRCVGLEVNNKWRAECGAYEEHSITSFSFTKVALVWGQSWKPQCLAQLEVKKRGNHLQQDEQSLPWLEHFNYGQMGSKAQSFRQVVFLMQSASPGRNLGWRNQMVVLMMQQNLMMKYSSWGRMFHHSVYL